MLVLVMLLIVLNNRVCVECGFRTFCALGGPSHRFTQFNFFDILFAFCNLQNVAQSISLVVAISRSALLALAALRQAQSDIIL
jgi:hypothetical protein